MAKQPQTEANKLAWAFVLAALEQWRKTPEPDRRTAGFTAFDGVPFETYEQVSKEVDKIWRDVERKAGK